MLVLVYSGGQFQPLKIIPTVIPTRIYTAAGTVRLEHVYSIPWLSGAKKLQSARGKKLLAHILTVESGFDPAQLARRGSCITKYKDLQLKM